jgi:Holliday junction resolvase
MNRIQRLVKFEPKEKQVTTEIRRYLKIRGIWHYKQWQGLGSFIGVSDIIGIYKGRYLAIEVKAPKKEPSENQRAFIDRVNHEGGLAFVARSVDDVITGLAFGDLSSFKPPTGGQKRDSDN